MSHMIKWELISLFVLPFVLAILRRRTAITDKQQGILVATLLSLFVASLYLSLGKPKTLLSVAFEDWLVAVGLSFFCWVFAYLFSRWFLGQWAQK